MPNTSVDPVRRKAGDELAALQQALHHSEQEKQFFSALCADYTSAYLCDLMADTMTPLKRAPFSHSAIQQSASDDPALSRCFSRWIHYSYNTIVVRDVSPEYIEVFDNQHLMNRLRTQESFVYRHKTIPNQAGMQYFEARAVRLFVDDTHFQIIIGFRPIDDIVEEELTARRKLEDALRRAEDANKAKSAFLFNMSHDIRTPMNAILGYTELLSTHLDDTEKRTDYIRKIKYSSEYLLSLLNDVLEMARIESGKQTLDETVTDLAAFDEMLFAVFENQMEQKNLRYTHTRKTEHTLVYCDNVKVKEVLLNILSNAYKYTPPGGQIDLTVTELPSDQPGCAQYRTVISDTGIGMTESFLSTIYDSFSRAASSTDSGQTGSGLGMAITKRLMDLMGGTIDIQSRPGQGTTVTIWLTHRLAEPAPADHAAPAPAAQFTGKRLLLTEDNDLNAEIAQELLQTDGFAVERACDGVDCIAKLETHPAGYYDLILMDIQMPNMDGYKATTLIRGMGDASLANIPIVAMTANAFAEDRQKALATGMNAHIAKPIDLAVLHKTLAEFLSK